jgi:hypothetical protein
MPKEQLHTTLQELQLELERVNFDDDNHRNTVNQSIVTIQKKLRDESFMSGDEYIVHELKEALEQFEEKHPKITDLVGRVSDLLSKIGI